MKRASIKAGVVCAIKPGSDYGTPSPVMFLEDGAAGIYSRQRGGGFRPEVESAHVKAHKGSGWSDDSIGYAVIEQDWSSPGTDPAPLPWSLDVAAELERFRAGDRPSIAGLKFDIQTSLAKVALYDDTVAEQEARQAARAADRARSDEHRARVDAAREGLRALGIDAGHTFGTAKIELPVWEVEKLLAMLRDREA